jgi:hypothetical protein
MGQNIIQKCLPAINNLLRKLREDGIEDFQHLLTIDMGIDLVIDKDDWAVCAITSAQPAGEIDIDVIFQPMLLQELLGNIDICRIAACETRTANADFNLFHLCNSLGTKTPERYLTSENTRRNHTPGISARCPQLRALPSDAGATAP